MRHTNFKNTDESIRIVNDSNEEFVCLMYIPNEPLVYITPESITQINNHFIADLTTPATDCFLLVQWGKVVEILRVGTPPVLLIVHSDSGLELPVTQFSLGGTVIGSGLMNEIADGFYSRVPYSYVDSFFEIDNRFLITLKLPYLIGEPIEIPPESGAGSLSDMVFLDTPYRYATFAFTGDRYSYFDLEDGMWKPSPDPAEGEVRYTCKAVDLMKAFCSYYDISYDRTADVNITQYINTIRVFDENVGFFRGFQPSITPVNSPNNFDVIYDDEFGNTVYQGLQILFVGIPLTTASDEASSAGIIIPFTNKAFEERHID